VVESGGLENRCAGNPGTEGSNPSPSAIDALAVELLEAAAAEDAVLVDELAALVTAVYATAESGLWREGAARTTPAELAGLIRAQELAVARRGARVVGCVHVYDVADGTDGFGMLVADPDARGSGIGNALLDFAEELGRARGQQTMRLELLVPREWTHPSKEFLRGWYGRRGYRLVRTTTLAEDYPHLEPLLATPCDLEIHEKVL
jgi:GNAT superfamily N-acetyltransferase